MEQKVLQGSRVWDCFTALTYQLGQSTSGHLNISEIRMHLPINDILQLICRVVFILSYPLPWTSINNDTSYNEWYP